MGKVPDVHDLYHGMETVMMLVEIPKAAYAEMEKLYNLGIATNLFDLTFEQWIGGATCHGVYMLKDQMEKSAGSQINKDELIHWLKMQITFHDDAASKLERAINAEDIRVGPEFEHIIASESYRKVLDKIITKGRM